VKKILLLMFVIASVSEAISSIEAIEQTYQNTQTFQAEFTQSTYVDLLEKTITRSGRIFYQRGGKLRIEYAGDKMTHYLSDGKRLWVLDPKAKEKDVYSLKDSGLPEEALKFLTELGQLRQYFNVSEKKGKTVLKPKKKSTYRSLDCIFGEDHYLKELTIHTASGNTSNYRFFNLQTDVKFPAKLFQP